MVEKFSLNGVKVNNVKLADKPYKSKALNNGGTSQTLYTTAHGGMPNPGSAYMLCSFWIKYTGFNGLTIIPYSTSGSKLLIQRSNNNKYYIRGQRPSDAVTVVAYNSDGVWSTANGWHHILFSWDVDAGNGKFFINDVEQTVGITVSSANTVDWYESLVGFYGGPTYANKTHCSISDFYMTAEYLDLSIEANRRKFISAANTPVYLGRTGQYPTGNTPFLYMPMDDPSDPSRNLGTWPKMPTVSGTFTIDTNVPGS